MSRLDLQLRKKHTNTCNTFKTECYPTFFNCAILTNSLKSGSTFIKFGSLKYWVTEHHKFNLDQTGICQAICQIKSQYLIPSTVCSTFFSVNISGKNLNQQREFILHLYFLLCSCKCFRWCCPKTRFTVLFSCSLSRTSNEEDI